MRALLSQVIRQCLPVILSKDVGLGFSTETGGSSTQKGQATLGSGFVKTDSTSSVLHHRYVLNDKMCIHVFCTCLTHIILHLHIYINT